jgi:anti-anti-sigma factor
LNEQGSLFPPLEQDFELSVRAEPHGTVVTVSGELDVASSHELERELARQETALVVVDLRRLTFIDSTGLGVLVRAHQRAQEQGRRIGC